MWMVINMNNKKWGVANSDTDLCYVVLWVSRQKDNKDMEGFKERRKSFICTVDMIVHYAETFKKTFVNDGLPGELSRMYISVNARHMPTIRKQLMHFLMFQIIIGLLRRLICYQSRV